MILKTVILATLWVVLAACSPASIPPQENASSAIESFVFEAQPGSQGQYLEQPIVSATGGEGQITINATLSTPDPCHQLTGTAEQNGSQLTVRAIATPQSEGACIMTIGNFSYEARITDLSPGRYQLEVIHEYPNAGWEEGTVLSQTVDVS
ncbi:hypothetical protein H6G20_19440 [Desertifilum sp. FACHB-1129]|uniref:Lipoprotein n=1 Tax=Desertifilum tharense IPPAS B-1220 TaxID=1781255 RepID=A0A1E5QQJ9_9CYAN|nr:MULTISPECIES: hypothetical protein [Desertifilum]MDA0212474.1 hypothetical protein [Cyanobacteria bacterium FC1]MBD2313847.1 hypothetical protein [Desertifilum sp. FACHB-1129]MBD2323246.1 hypothetical protein [Desertifilum sp. FACHB-866]MBD2333091.1 hypothetical protein [Desertifilum sp. FACHB-868]OEJ76928.1 hypothetical protein BH720_01670 [Desertifilum tharense IPPAS B-1220]